MFIKALPNDPKMQDTIFSSFAITTDKKDTCDLLFAI